MIIGISGCTSNEFCSGNQNHINDLLGTIKKKKINNNKMTRLQKMFKHNLLILRYD